SARAPTQRFVDRFARVYTPLVALLALAIAILPPLLGLGGWYEWVYKALVLLVIACPCALVISTPVSIVSGLAAAARHGVLVKGGVHLEQGRLLRWIALDKTGTVTHGRPALTDAMALGSADPARSHALAAALAARSDHPVSRAVAQGLLQLAPERASVRQADGGWRDVPARDVSPGTLVRVRPGERIALDGRVEAGRSALLDSSPDWSLILTRTGLLVVFGALMAAFATRAFRSYQRTV
ncbi:MAG: HAD family hydrolase, partial [Solirubrobacterales bacterium]|nr:HAD family hydrolase [Solirubrobacterales bacterium]